MSESIFWFSPQQVDALKLEREINRRVAEDQKCLARKTPQAPEEYGNHKYHPPKPGSRKPSFPRQSKKLSLPTENKLDSPSPGKLTGPQGQSTSTGMGEAGITITTSTKPTYDFIVRKE